MNVNAELPESQPPKSGPPSMLPLHSFAFSFITFCYEMFFGLTFTTRMCVRECIGLGKWTKKTRREK